MRKKSESFELVRELGLALPGMEESTMYGSPALKVRGSLVACLPTHKSAEPRSLMVSIDLDRRAGLLADGPETYYVTEHYRSHPVVLVRLSRIKTEELCDLLGAACRFVTSRQTGGKRRRRPSGTARR